jgi:hypothetical protein
MPVGTLQCYNKINSDITYSDLERLNHFRKLLGGTLKKCEYWAITLQIIIGLNLKSNSMKGCVDGVDNLVQTRKEMGINNIGLMVNSVQDGFEKYDLSN